MGKLIALLKRILCFLVEMPLLCGLVTIFRIEVIQLLNPWKGKSVNVLMIRKGYNNKFKNGSKACKKACM